MAFQLSLRPQTLTKLRCIRPLSSSTPPDSSAAVPDPSSAPAAAAPPPPPSFASPSSDIKDRNFKKNHLDKPSFAAADDPKRTAHSLDSIRESLRKFPGVQTPKHSSRGLDNLTSRFTPPIKTDQLPSSVFGKEKPTDDTDEKAPKTEKELREKLRRLRSEVLDNRFSIAELNDRLVKLGEMEEKVADSRMGGDPFLDPRERDLRELWPAFVLTSAAMTLERRYRRLRKGCPPILERILALNSRMYGDPFPMGGDPFPEVRERLSRVRAADLNKKPNKKAGEMEEKVADSRMGGDPFRDLRESLSSRAADLNKKADEMKVADSRMGGDPFRDIRKSLSSRAADLNKKAFRDLRESLSSVRAADLNKKADEMKVADLRIGGDPFRDLRESLSSVRAADLNKKADEMEEKWQIR